MRVDSTDRRVIWYKDEKLIFTLKKATNKQVNKFLGERYPKHRNKITDDSVMARSRFFDNLFEKVEIADQEKEGKIKDETLDTKDGVPITKDNLEELPLNWKNSMIFNLYEDSAEEGAEDSDSKN